MPNPETAERERWPELPLAAWRDTYATLHRYTQVVGKIRLALAPPMNHWWQVAFYVTPRGLTTSNIPYPAGTFAVDFDAPSATSVSGVRCSPSIRPRSPPSSCRMCRQLSASWPHTWSAGSPRPW